MYHVESADDSKIKGLYLLWKDTLFDKETNVLTDAQLSVINSEHMNHVSGESKSYTWDEVKARIRNKKAT